MEYRDYIIILYDYYGELFNDKQKRYFEDYYFNNLSLGEISDNIGISRNAIHKVITTVSEKLIFYEDKLNLYKKAVNFKKILSEIKDEDLLKKLEEFYWNMKFIDKEKLPVEIKNNQ